MSEYELHPDRILGLPVFVTAEQERDIIELKRGGDPGQLVFDPADLEPAETDDAA